MPAISVLSNLCFRRGRSAVAVLSGVLAAVRLLAAEPAPGPVRWQHLKTALFFTSYDVAALLGQPADRQAALAYFAPLRLSKVYLEAGDGEEKTAARLGEIATALRATGLEVSGAVVPANHGPLCYNNPADMALLEARVRVLARVFDEIIVDDWLFTTCTCAKCLEGRGSDSWADYRSRLVAEQSKKHLIDAARAVRPGVRVIIKYPNWYEGHRQNGYDAARQTPQFDGVSVGIETRQPTTQDQHIPIYSGYVFQRWLGGDAGAKWRSAWLDNYGMPGDDQLYVAQVYQAVLARAPEIIFWCAGQLHPPLPESNVFPHLAEMMPEFDRLAGLLRGPPRGIPFHLPLGAVGEYNLFGHLGSIGLPLAPGPAFPTDAKAAIFTLHSLRDPQLADELLARVRAGKEVFLTWPLLRQLGQSELGRAFNIINRDGTVTATTFRAPNAAGDPDPVESVRPISFPLIQLSIWPYVREVALVREDGDFGVLLRTPYLEGQVDLLNLPENLSDLQRLPEPALNAIRRTFFDDLGVRLVGPAGVPLYLFGPNQYALYNLNATPARVSLRFPPAANARHWREVLHGKQLNTAEVAEGTGRDTRHEFEVALTLLPFELALVESD